MVKNLLTHTRAMKKSLIIITVLLIPSLIGLVYATTLIGSGDNVNIPVGKKFFLDSNSKSYIWQPFEGRVEFYTSPFGSSTPQRAMTITEAGTFWFESQKPIYLDGGVNTFFYEWGNDHIVFATNNQQALHISPTQDIWIHPTKRLYFDAGFNDYISNTAGNRLDFASNGVTTITVNEGKVGIGNTAPTQALDVTGNIKLTGNIVSNGDICIGNC
ncbi:hypothetical protein [Candidatus Nitrosotenuis uzonensis]|uniref:hypothetical protein n=1 Tax=Candidatus Nitrosotenuis uzonensis TaxID=1407055 RepID=UPI001961B2B3|nr:hypothetical protein [Candidatus Nitrosotenuis uzonensis]